jgi:hypothetical protein
MFPKRRFPCIRVACILPIEKYLIKEGETFLVQQSKVTDESTKTSCSEAASRKANQEYRITR